MSGVPGWMRAGLLVLAIACCSTATAPGSDALDAYRALPRDARAGILECARQAIATACAPGAPRVAPHSAAPAAVRPAAGTQPAGHPAPDWPGPPCGVYLSLARGTRTRACVGSLTPLGGTLSATLRELARRVISDDPRHPPVRGEELDSLTVLVSFAGPPEPIADPMSIAPAREGLLITSARGSIAFLPGEARTVSWALSEARRVGMLQRASDASFQRFSVVVLKHVPTAASR